MRQPAPARRFFLAIGLGRPGGALRPLPGVADDLRRMTAQFGRLGYVTAALRADPSASQLRAAFAGWLARAGLRAGDALVVYVSGHGAVVDGDHYLCCRGWNRDSAAMTGLKTEDLIELAVRRTDRPGKLWMIVDCCAAGDALTGALHRTLAASPVELSVLAAAAPWSPTADGAFSRAFAGAFGDLTGPRREAISPDALAAAINRRRPDVRAVHAGIGWSRFDLLEPAGGRI